jgi:hypothetical protein
MQIFKYSLSILLLAVSALADAKVEPPTELKIDVTHLPNDCPAKARTGDSIQVHYVSAHWRVSKSEQISEVEVCGRLERCLPMVTSLIRGLSIRE